MGLSFSGVRLDNNVRAAYPPTIVELEYLVVAGGGGAGGFRTASGYTAFDGTN